MATVGGVCLGQYDLRREVLRGPAQRVGRQVVPLQRHCNLLCESEVRQLDMAVWGRTGRGFVRRGGWDGFRHWRGTFVQQKVLRFQIPEMPGRVRRANGKVTPGGRGGGAALPVHDAATVEVLEQ